MRTAWKDMTDAQKARQREYSRIYRMSAKGKASALARKRRWNANNRDHKNAKGREFYARHKGDDAWLANRAAMRAEWSERNREKVSEYSKEWRKSHPNYGREYQRMWNMLNRDRVCEYQRAYYDKNRERILEQGREYRKTHKDTRKNRNRWQKMKLVFARDAAAYAKYREAERMRRAKRAEKMGRVYIPRFNIRIPDHVPFGVISSFAACSQFVYDNLSVERRREVNGFARELLDGRDVWRNANGR